MEDALNFNTKSAEPLESSDWDMIRLERTYEGFGMLSDGVQNHNRTFGM